MNSNSHSAANDNQPRASLLGLPTELRLAIYDYVFEPFEHRQWNPLVQYEKGYRWGDPKRGLSLWITNNGQEHWVEIVFGLFGSASESREDCQHFTAIFSVPLVCRQIRIELRNLVLEIPPISKICFAFVNFTRRDMERFVDAIGDENTKSIRKWIIKGSSDCQNRVYRNGHLFKGYHGGPGPCSFFEDGVEACNRRCIQLDQTYRDGKCKRHVTVELDKHEERDDRLKEIAPWKNVWRVDNVTAEDRLEKLRLGLGFERQRAKQALLLYRHVMFSKCRRGQDTSDGCFFSEPMDELLDERGEVEVSKKTLVGMLEAVMGR